MTGSAQTNPVTILVAEDEPTQRMMVAATLRTAGYTVLDAADGAAAETLSFRFGVPIDLLLTDFVMPDMDGHDLAERLRPHFPLMKVLIMSGHIEEATVQKGVMEEAFKRGAAFIQKPFKPEELVRKVRAVLGGMAGG